MNEKRRLHGAHGEAAGALHRRRCTNDSRRAVRGGRGLRFVVLAAIAALITTAVAPAGSSAAGSSAIPIGQRESTLDVTEDRARDRDSEDHRRPQDKKSITLRIRLGQTVSMTTTPEPLESGDGTAPKVRPSSGQAASWSLVASPANAEVTHQPGAPSFIPDVHGTYIFEGKPGRGHGVGARRHTLTVQVEPVERLLCVNTRVRPAGQPTTPLGMNVGEAVFFRASTDLDALQVVVLDRATAGLPHDGTPENSTFLPTDTDFAAYAKFLASLDNSHLVLVSGVVTPLNKEQVWAPLERLGAVDIALQGAGSSAFSFVGIPGISKGSAWQTVANHSPGVPIRTSCDAEMAGQPAINLSGWLTVDTTGTAYTYLSPDFVDFDTEASAPRGVHAIEVGNQTYTVPTGQFSGFHALVLDRRAICRKATPMSECDPGPPLLNQGYGPDNNGLEALNAALAPWTNNPDVLLFLTPFAGTDGAMPGAVPGIDLITTLRAFGASPLAPGRSLGDGVKYALVGGGMNNGLPDGSAKPIVAESLTGLAHGTGHIAGTLVRDHQNRFGPREASLTGTQLDTLGDVAYGPTSPWPEAGDPDLEAAFAYLSGRLGFPVGTQHPHGVRDQYLAWNTESSVPDPNTRLQQTWCTTDRPATIGATACATVLHELHNEFLEVKFVDHFLELLKTAYFEVEAGQETETIIKKVESDIRSTLVPPPAETSPWMTLLSFVLSLGGAFPEAGEIFGLVGANVDLAESLSTDSGGSSADPMQAVYDTGDELLAATDAAFANAVASIDAYQPLIVSDYAKLTLVGHRAATDKFNDGTDLPDPPWVITNDDLAAARTGLEVALKQWLYPPLVDAGFPVWRIVIPSANGFNGADRTPVTYRCWGGGPFGTETTHPFGNEPADGWIKLSNGHDDYYLALGGTRFTPEDLEEGGHHAPVPAAALLAEMFGRLPEHVGLDRTWYFEHTFKRILDAGGALVIECYPPDAPTLLAPDAFAQFSPGQSITFKWTNVKGAASFTIQIDDSETFSTPLIVNQTINGVEFTTSTLPTTEMLWRVRANGPSGNPGPWSSVGSFAVTN
jgi:hypothetical protein